MYAVMGGLEGLSTRDGFLTIIIRTGERLVRRRDVSRHVRPYLANIHRTA